MTIPAPICLFVFNRLDHTRRTVESLAKNELASDSDLFVFSDGPRNLEEKIKVDQLRGYLKQIQGFKSLKIIEREKNFGLAKSIIDGVSSIVNQYGKVIVVEDDLVTSPYFLKYMNDGLSIYSDAERVGSIHGYVYPIRGLPETFFIKGADCWGWATWKSRWEKFNPDGQFLLDQLRKRKLVKEFEFNGSYPYVRMLKNQISGKNNSWAVRWLASCFIQDMYVLYPGKSLVLNIGHDESGTHCSPTDEFDVDLYLKPIPVKKIPVETSAIGFQKFAVYHRKNNLNRWQRLLKKIWKLK
jgi:hypothetical protein